MSAEERAEFSRHMSELGAEKQAITLEAGATRNSLPWEEWEDNVLLNESLTGVERALRLQRTYYSTVRQRAVRLLERGDDGRLQRPVRDAAVLCPCGSLDGDHEDWCPNG